MQDQDIVGRHKEARELYARQLDARMPNGSDMARLVRRGGTLNPDGIHMAAIRALESLLAERVVMREVVCAIASVSKNGSNTIDLLINLGRIGKMAAAALQGASATMEKGNE